VFFPFFPEKPIQKWRQLRLIDRQLVEVDAADVASGEAQLFVHK